MQPDAGGDRPLMRISPGKAGSREGWMLTSRPSQRPTNPAVSTRMKPASATSPMPCRASTACIAASKPGRSPRKPRLSTTAVGMPAAAARREAGGIGAVASTRTISAG